MMREVQLMVQIITDSSTLHTVEQAKELGFETLPLCVSIDDMEGRDLQIDMEDFYKRILEGQIPRSSQPPIGEVVEMYEKYKEDEIINIAMADGLSGTYQSACSAREMVENKENIHVFNTRTLCGPHRHMVETAQKMKEAGKTVAEILEWLEMAANHSESFLIPQDFGFLKRGGRLAPMAAAFGSVLKLKPVMTQVERGTRLDKFCISRTMNAAVKNIINHFKEKGLDKRYILYISHAEALEDAKRVKKMLQEAFKDIEIRMMDLGAAFVTQGGPKCVAIQYVVK